MEEVSVNVSPAEIIGEQCIAIRGKDMIIKQLQGQVALKSKQLATLDAEVSRLRAQYEPPAHSDPA